jgi:hypothetical protein
LKQWPRTAYITDPVRLSVVCSGPSDMLQVSFAALVGLFWNLNSSAPDLRICCRSLSR